MVWLTAFLSGLVFAVGLMGSGMANPAKVKGFLDLAGLWDPSLAFVMAGAMGVAALAFLLMRRRTRSLLGLPLQWPSAHGVTMRLVLGSVAFGVGWGLAGFCPGPALVALAAGHAKAWGFVGAMLAGMAVFEGVEALRAGKGSRAAGLTSR